MNSITKRLTALILTLIMAIQIVPINVHAATGGAANDPNNGIPETGSIRWTGYSSRIIQIANSSKGKGTATISEYTQQLSLYARGQADIYSNQNYKRNYWFPTGKDVSNPTYETTKASINGVLRVVDENATATFTTSHSTLNWLKTKTGNNLAKLKDIISDQVLYGQLIQEVSKDTYLQNMVKTNYGRDSFTKTTANRKAYLESTGELGYICLLLMEAYLMGDYYYSGSNYKMIKTYSEQLNMDGCSSFVIILVEVQVMNTAKQIFRYDRAVEMGSKSLTQARIRTTPTTKPANGDSRTAAINFKKELPTAQSSLYDYRSILVGGSSSTETSYMFYIYANDLANTANKKGVGGFTFIADSYLKKDEQPQPVDKDPNAYVKTYASNSSVIEVPKGTTAEARVSVSTHIPTEYSYLDKVDQLAKQDAKDAVAGVALYLDRMAAVGNNTPIWVTIEIERMNHPEAGQVIDRFGTQNNKSEPTMDKFGLNGFTVSQSGNKATIKWNMNEGKKASESRGYQYFISGLNKPNGGILNNLTFYDEGILPTQTAGTTSEVVYKITSKIDFPAVAEWKNGDTVYEQKDPQQFKGLLFETPARPSPVINTSYKNLANKRNPGYEYVQFKVVDSDKPTYSNVMEDPYAELKNNSPGLSGEQFEAMAGVPTTKPLYLQLGATEFLVDYKGDVATDSGKSRQYTFTYTAVNIIDTHAACTGGSCPGHTVSNSDGSTSTITHGSAGACGFATCNHNQPGANPSHPYNKTYTYTITMPINEYTYMDIKEGEVWSLNDLKLLGNSSLLTEPNQSKTIALGNNILDVGSYSSNSGRLHFDNGITASDSKWGDNSWTKTTNFGKTTLRPDVDKTVLAEVNAVTSALPDVKVTVVSDYIVLGTSEGQQVIYYHEQESNSVRVANTFTGEGSYTTPAVTFNKKEDINSLWKNKTENSWNVKAGYTPTDVAYTGYNGDYASPATKMNTSNKYVIATDPAAKWATEKNPAIVYKATPTYGKNFNNTALRISNIDIINTALNGEYDTGVVNIAYNKVYSKGRTNLTFANSAKIDNVPYSGDHTKVNDIVVHNPVSAQYAIVLSNDVKYDKRTDAELFQNAAQVSTLGVCPGDETCEHKTITCGIPLSYHTESCKSPISTGIKHNGGLNYHEHNANCGLPQKITQTSSYSTSSTGQDVYTFTAPKAGVVKFYSTYCSHDPVGYIYVNGFPVASDDDSGGFWNFSTSGRFTEGSTVRLNVRKYGNTASGTINWVAEIEYDGGACNDEPNVHKCNDKCEEEFIMAYNCGNPHHQNPDEPLDPNAAHSPSCWTPCNDNSKHNAPGEVVVDGKAYPVGGAFINVDREFQIYFPFEGDFAQNPSMLGIGETTSTRGKGYINNMSTREYTEKRWVTFDYDVICLENNKAYHKGYSLDLNTIDKNKEIFNFYVPLSENEYYKVTTNFNSVAINSPTEGNDFFDFDNREITNKDRNFLQSELKYGAAHNAQKDHYIDVVGSIGSLTINDTGDFRFATLFKKETGTGWLVEGLVPAVNTTLPNKLVSDTKNVKWDDAVAATKWQSTYFKTYANSGGKAYEFLTLPLTPDKNPIEGLRNQPMRVGYNLYMDFETIGNYYGENKDDNNNFVDTNQYYKSQITPKYYSLNLDTGKYTPVDAYYGVNGEYMMAYQFNYKQPAEGEASKVNEYNYFLDWANESARRNYTASEKATTDSVFVTDTTRNQNSRMPVASRISIGSANMLFLSDRMKTSIGNTKTYGVDRNPGNEFDEHAYMKNSQRYHFTLGLPSSTVFVEAGKPVNDINIKAIQKQNNVIVLGLDIKTRGDVWTLQYDGSSINTFEVFGKTYTKPPKFEEVTGGTMKEIPNSLENIPIVSVYDGDVTSSSDLMIEGSQ